MNATVVSVREVPIPHSARFSKVFTLEYSLNSLPSKKDLLTNVTMKEVDVKSDRIRFLATSDGQPTHVDGSPLLVSTAIGKVLKPMVHVEASTGVGAWQTVSVQLVDEEEVEKQRLVLEEKEKEEKRLEALRQLQVRLLY